MGTNLIIPHIVGNAGVLRNFSAYLSQLLDVDSKTDLQVHTSGGLDLDFLAFGLSLGLTLLLILGTHESSLFNLGAPPLFSIPCVEKFFLHIHIFTLHFHIENSFFLT